MPNEITDAIIELLNNKHLRDDFIEKGYIQSQQFSWENMAKDVLELYKTVYKKNHPDDLTL
jgi:glycosyltransferase involved in cell wall biosynthesis